MLPPTASGEIRRLLTAQDGVISRRQAQRAGAAPHDLERLVRRREWSRVLPGVFVDHTGPLEWRQRAWAGVLHYWPAALGGESAIRAVLGNGWRVPRATDGLIVIAVDASRNVRAHRGYRPRYVSGLVGLVQDNASPPRIRLDDALLLEAGRARSDWAAIDVLASACGSRGTTPRRLADALARHPRLRRRRWLLPVLDDLAAGTCSVLEHGFVTQVERPHGLPRARRQQPDRLDGGRIYRDASYDMFSLYVELDGQLVHGTPTARDSDLDRDLDRDLDAASGGRRTVRLGCGQVFDRPCRTAARLASLLEHGGWSGRPRSCGPACEL
ncbi:MAG: type IV toxin-antitoxin system AbiEi family antitoxin domain-containing protein [Nocardioides sp.]